LSTRKIFYISRTLEYKSEYEVIEFDNLCYDLDKLSTDLANLFAYKSVNNID